MRGRGRSERGGVLSPALGDLQWLLDGSSGAGFFCLFFSANISAKMLPACSGQGSLRGELQVSSPTSQSCQLGPESYLLV